MPNSRLTNNIQKTLWLQLNVGVFITLLVVAKAIIMPLVIALFIWMLIHALAEKISSHYPQLQKQSLAIALIVALSLVIAVVQVARLSAFNLIAEIPKFGLRWEQLIQSHPLINSITIDEFIGDLNITENLQYLARTIISLSGNLFLTILYVVFLFLEQRSFPEKLALLTQSQDAKERLAFLYSSLSEKIQTYVWIKSIISLSTGFVTFICLLIFGLKFAGIWGLLTFLLNYIPHFGSFIAVLLAFLFSLLQFEHLYSSALLLACLVGIQIFFGNVLEPRFMGQSLNLSPLVILVSLVTWGLLWGVAGAFLAVPLMVILAIILAEFPSTRWIAIILSKDGLISPESVTANS